MRCKQVAMKLTFPLCHFLIILLLVSGCVPRQAAQIDGMANYPRLLAATDFVSKISVSHAPQGMELAGGNRSVVVQAIHEGSEKILTSSPSEAVYSHVEAALVEETRSRLLESGRWKENAGNGVELHLEITHLRLRRSAAQLLLYYVAGNDELSVRVTLARGGKAFASSKVATRLESGGMYGTISLNRRLDFLSQQLARKLVRSRL